MARSTVGVIFSNIHDENIPEISSHRTMASVPFGGRYRLIDFALSNMVNSGITTVGIVTKNNYQSLIDHLGSGKDWDLARKDGGIILLPPYSNETDKPYSTRLEALMGITSFLRHRNEDYVVISDCDGIAHMNIGDIVNYHEEKGADITMVYHEEKEPSESSYFITLQPDQEGRITGLKINPSDLKKGKKYNLYINIMIMSREFLINTIQSAVQRGFSSFGRDILAKKVNTLKIYGYEFKGYYAAVDSLQDYYKHSMELLNKPVREELFGARDIYTKVRDSAPSKYLTGAVVKDSLISDGCVIEGTVENCILFRGVKIGKGTQVKNCVLMQDTVIGENVKLESVITDKNVVIRDRRTLAGCAELPYFVSKGRML
ncbi:MAG: glucose-1-phosphate adenylyltransferase subunit GlgD [Clostridia bacterium]|nr:glucose-1-phosphate adenylyltransferase subunit GlgD [Clostridia bacterium]